MKMYKYIFLWPDGDIHLYIAFNLFDVVNDIEKTNSYDTRHAKIIKRPALAKDLDEVNTIVLDKMGRVR